MRLRLAQIWVTSLKVGEKLKINYWLTKYSPISDLLSLLKKNDLNQDIRPSMINVNQVDQETYKEYRIILDLKHDKNEVIIFF